MGEIEIVLKGRKKCPDYSRLLREYVPPGRAGYEVVKIRESLASLVRDDQAGDVGGGCE